MYLLMLQECDLMYSNLCMFQSPVVPLYLGADLFSNTGIRTENHPRCHAKFAKKGLATKIKFSSGKIQDKNTFSCLVS